MLVKSHSSSITWCFNTDSYLSHVDEHGHTMVAKEEMHGKLIFFFGSVTEPASCMHALLLRVIITWQLRRQCLCLEINDWVYFPQLYM